MAVFSSSGRATLLTLFVIIIDECLHSAASSLTSTAAEKGESKVGESEVSSADVLLCVALFQYVSDEPGDLSFEAGETIEVIKKVKK